jgi:hypothetical protein
VEDFLKLKYNISFRDSARDILAIKFHVVGNS